MSPVPIASDHGIRLGASSVRRMSNSHDAHPRLRHKQRHRNVRHATGHHLRATDDAHSVVRGLLRVALASEESNVGSLPQRSIHSPRITLGGPMALYIDVVKTEAG